MRTPELEARHRASAAVAKMFVDSLQAMMRGLEWGNNIHTMLPELLIAMVVRLNDSRDSPPISISEITRMTGMPRQTVRRHIAALIERGVVIRQEHGIIGNDTYLWERVDANYFKAIVRAIRAAAKELDGFE